MYYYGQIVSKLKFSKLYTCEGKGIGVGGGSGDNTFPPDTVFPLLIWLPRDVYPTEK